jgi:hypothetical protein
MSSPQHLFFGGDLSGLSIFHAYRKIAKWVVAASIAAAAGLRLEWPMLCTGT